MKDSEQRVHLSLGSHGAEDVAKIPSIHQSVLAFFSIDPRVRNLYFLESFGVDSNRAENLQKRARRDSHFAITLKANLGEGVAIEDVEDFRSYITQGRFPPYAQTDNESTLFSLAHANMLDEVAKSRRFEAVWEAYDPSVMRVLNRQLSEHSTYDRRLYEAVQAGNFESALDNYQLSRAQYRAFQNTRDRSISRTVTDTLRRANKAGVSVAYFIRLGEQHRFVADYISDNPDTKRMHFTLTQSADEDNHLLHFREKIENRIRQNGETAVDEGDQALGLLESLVDHVLQEQGVPRITRSVILQRVVTSASTQDVKDLIGSVPHLGLTNAVVKLIA